MSRNPVVTPIGNGTSPAISPITPLFPRLSWAGGSTPSYAEFLVQLPLMDHSGHPASDSSGAPECDISEKAA